MKEWFQAAWQKVVKAFATVIAFFQMLFGISVPPSTTPNAPPLLGITYEYLVGKDKNYETINDALAQWRADGYPKAKVYISNGEYTEACDYSVGGVEADGTNIHTNDKIKNIKSVIFIGGGKKKGHISFIGESRNGVVLRTTSGEYLNAPVFIRSGDVTIENMTIIADHKGNPNFSYGDGSQSKAYALHIDGGFNPGKITIKNVKAISYQSAAFGMGTIPNSIIRLEDCEAISYTDILPSNVHSSGGKCLSYGSLLCHSSSALVYPKRGKEKLELINVVSYSKNSQTALYLRNGANNVKENFNITAINVNLKSDVADDGIGQLIFVNKNGGGGLKFSVLSRDNIGVGFN